MASWDLDEDEWAQIHTRYCKAVFDDIKFQKQFESQSTWVQHDAIQKWQF